MRDYELALVIDPDLSGEDREKQTAKIKKIIEELKGKVNKTEDWGKKKFAYPIQKKELGYYFLWQVQLPEKTIAEVEAKLRMEKELLRHLLVKREKPAKS